MLQFAEIAKMRQYSVPDRAKECREDLDVVERAINEVAAPVAAVETEILKIRQAIERGNALKKADFVQFSEQGGENLIAELEKALSDKPLRLEKLLAEISNQQQPLQITKSNLLAFLAKKREKGQLRKEREELLRVKKETRSTFSDGSQE